MTKYPSRNRKVSCPECGYTVRMARSWMERGLPVCPCGQAMRPESGADLAWCGLIGPDDMPGPAWTAICRENGWTDAIQRKGAAAKAHERKLAADGGILGRRAGAGHCVYPGCCRWVADGAEHCAAGHAQHEQAPPLEACPF